MEIQLLLQEFDQKNTLLSISVMELFQNNHAEELLKNHSFVNQWRGLLKVCPWTTVFQSPEFIINWYFLFPNYKKIILCEMKAGEPIGLLFLTQDQNGEIVGAGTNMAEYQSWICKPENQSFPLQSFKFLTKTFPEKLIHLKYIPDGNFKFNKITQIGRFHSFLSIEHERPIMEAQVEWIEKELKKKNRKEKINRLKRIGNLEFEKVEDLGKFEYILSDLVFQNDLRKGAMYGKTAFIDEPERKEFLVQLFKSDLLHVSVLKVNNDIIASNVGIKGDDKVYLQGLNTISPYFMRYSPGILHFLMLGKQLSIENIQEFDLTPGGVDGYKSMLSTKSQKCHEIIVGKKTKIFTIGARQSTKDWLAKIGLEKYVSNFLSKLSQFPVNLPGVPLIYRYKLIPALSKEELDRKTTKAISQNLNMEDSRNKFSCEFENLSSLFSIGANLQSMRRQRFFQDCIKRMELGQTYYSIKMESKYVGLLWYWNNSSMKNEETESTTDSETFYEFSYINGISNLDLTDITILIHTNFNSKKTSPKLVIS